MPVTCRRHLPADFHRQVKCDSILSSLARSRAIILTASSNVSAWWLEHFVICWEKSNISGFNGTLILVFSLVRSRAIILTASSNVSPRRFELLVTCLSNARHFWGLKVPHSLSSVRLRAMILTARSNGSAVVDLSLIFTRRLKRNLRISLVYYSRHILVEPRS